MKDVRVKYISAIVVQHKQYQITDIKRQYHLNSLINVTSNLIITENCNINMGTPVSIILHLINLSNERPLFVPRDRPIFSRIGSKKVCIFFVLDD